MSDELVLVLSVGLEVCCQLYHVIPDQYPVHQGQNLKMCTKPGVTRTICLRVLLARAKRTHLSIEHATTALSCRGVISNRSSLVNSHCNGERGEMFRSHLDFHV